VSPRGAATDGADKRIARKQSSGTQLSSSSSNGNSGGGNLNQMPVARRRLTSIHLFDDPATIAEASEQSVGNSSSDEADSVLEDQDEIERRRQHYIQRDKTMNKITSAYTLMRERACVCD
jgi:hypothetical protein